MGALRWEVHFGDQPGALAKLDAEIDQAAATARRRRLLKLQVLRSLSLHKSGNAKAAMTQLNEALQVAAKEGFLRLIIDEGEAVGALVRRLAGGLHSDKDARQDPIFSDYLQRLAQMFPTIAVDEDAEQAASTGLIEELTQKETRILALLAEGYSNSALARKSCLSPTARCAPICAISIANWARKAVPRQSPSHAGSASLPDTECSRRLTWSERTRSDYMLALRDQPTISTSEKNPVRVCR